MKKTDRIVKLLASDIEHKDVLEVACGSADFSVSAARIANSVSCIDLDDNRLNDQVRLSNIRFQIMDASKMSYSDNEFDTIVIYNAFFHIQSQWNMIKKECKRVIKDRGKVYIIGTWILDINLMLDTFGDSAVWHDNVLIVTLAK